MRTRADAVASEAVRLDGEFRYKGALFDPHLVRQAVLLDTDGSTVLETVAAADIENPAVGVYYATFAGANLSAAGTYFDSWYVTLNNGDDEHVFTRQFRVIASSSPVTFPYDLKRYITTRLGGNDLAVELTDEDYLVIMEDVVDMFRNYIQKRGYHTIAGVTDDVQVTLDENIVGIERVDFLRTDDEDYTSFDLFRFPGVGYDVSRFGESYALQAGQKTAQYVYGKEQTWSYDPNEHKLWLSSPNREMKVNYITLEPYTFEELVHNRKYLYLVRKATLAYSRLIYAEKLNKFGGRIPGPMAGTIEVGARRQQEQGDAAMRELREQDLPGIANALVPLIS